MEGCPALLPDDKGTVVGVEEPGGLGGVWMCIFLVTAQATPVVASAASRDSGDSQPQTAGSSRPERGSSTRQDPCMRQETWN